MPEIEITPEQEERLRALQEEIARDVVGKYGHVRPRDAVEYLLDRYEHDEAADPGTATADAGDATTDAADAGDAGEPTDGTEAATARVVDDGGDDERGDGDDQARASNGDPVTGGDDDMLNEMMSLLDTHDDKWDESDGDERYAVALPDGTTEQVRTKDDVKALLFKHYR
ncbi:hypothetical protein ACOZ4L_12960 [Haloplanus ruber]|uniref:CopG family transcriptional regulator n=1 Tax=Haloplanus ruber TaxID=869892 RepID=A0ABD6CWX6_9EURY|nr:hypothetical protein [Haloplanus ruber]